jgi:uncharacterized membrane protein YdbT with pleckstrin-like domain
VTVEREEGGGPTHREKLSNGEKRVLALRPHWLGVAPPVALTIVLLVALAVALVAVPASWPAFVRWAILGIFGLFLGLWPFRRILAWATSHYVITNERIIHRAGLLTRRSVEIPIMGVADVIFSQNLLQRLGGTGDVVIESAGGMGYTRLSYIERADEVHRIIYELLEDAKASPVGSNNSHPKGPIDQVEQLAALLERGLITREEFDTHKKRLLKQL